MTKRRSRQDLVREFETTDMGDKLAQMPVASFPVANKTRGIASEKPRHTEPATRKRPKTV